MNHVQRIWIVKVYCTRVLNTPNTRLNANGQIIPTCDGYLTQAFNEKMYYVSEAVFIHVSHDRLACRMIDCTIQLPSLCRVTVVVICRVVRPNTLHMVARLRSKSYIECRLHAAHDVRYASVRRKIWGFAVITLWFRKCGVGQRTICSTRDIINRKDIVWL